MRNDQNNTHMLVGLTRRACLTLAGVVATTFWGGMVAAQSDLTVVNVVNTTSRMVDVSFQPLLVAQERGMFAAHGIEMKVNVSKNSQIGSASLLSGEVDIGMIQPAFMIAANASGANFRLIGSTYDNLDYFLITTPEITDVKQLEGKIEAGPGPNNGNTIVFRAAMESAGVDSSSITYATVGVQSAILAALKVGQAQAGLLVAAPAAEAMKAGLTNHGSVQKYLPDQISIGLVATEQWLGENPETAKDFLAAVTEAIQWMHENPEESLEMFAEMAEASTDDVKPIFDAGYALLGQDLSVSEQGLEDWINIALDYKLIENTISVDKVYDPSFLPAMSQ